MTNLNKARRALRVRSAIKATSKYPRLSVSRSNAHIWAQVIDDNSGKTLVSASDTTIKTGTKTEKAEKVGEQIAALALKSGIKQVVFDRGSYRFHGRVKQLAEVARTAGLTI